MKIVKRFFLGALLSIFALSLNAQTEAGKIYVGGSSDLSFGAMTVKVKSDNGTSTMGKQTSFSLAPEAGYFVMDGLAVGLGIDMSLDVQKPEDSDYKSSTTTVLFGPFAKYYYGTGNIKPFAQAGIAFGSMAEKDSYEGESETEKAGVFGFGFGIGAAMFMNDNVAFELGIGYQSASYKAKQDNPNDAKQVIGGIGVSVGIVVVL